MLVHLIGIPTTSIINCGGNPSYSNDAGIRITGSNTGFNFTNTKIYNNVFAYQTHDAGSSKCVEVSQYAVNTQIHNNIFHKPDGICLDINGASVSSHFNNRYHKPAGGTLVDDNGTTYTAATITTFEPGVRAY